MSELAGRQHGVFARWQLLEAGFGRGAIDRRVARGLLITVFPGVYAFGHVALRREGRWMAGVLTGGPGGALSHRSAAVAWGLLGWTGSIDVTVPRKLGPLRGLRRHHGALPADEVTLHRGIPATTVPRTIFDLAAVTDRSRVELAAHEAERQRLTDRLSLPDILARYPGNRGTAVLRAILTQRQLGIDVPHEEMERLFDVFLDERGFPRPLMNRPLELRGRWIKPDCMWPEARVIAELDGRATHEADRVYESDRLRDRRLAVIGWRVIRITWRQLTQDPDELEADLRALLCL